jgi:hypothetical protein
VLFAGRCVNIFNSIFHRNQRRLPVASYQLPALKRVFGLVLATGLRMELLDLSQVRFVSENEIDNAIYAVLCCAFCEDARSEIRQAIRRRLTCAPAPQQVVDAVCDELRERRCLRFEAQRRPYAAQVLAAFLDLPPAERADVSLMAVA